MSLGAALQLQMWPNLLQLVQQERSQRGNPEAAYRKRSPCEASARSVGCAEGSEQLSTIQHLRAAPQDQESSHTERNIKS